MPIRWLAGDWTGVPTAVTAGTCMLRRWTAPRPADRYADPAWIIGLPDRALCRERADAPGQAARGSRGTAGDRAHRQAARWSSGTPGVHAAGGPGGTVVLGLLAVGLAQGLHFRACWRGATRSGFPPWTMTSPRSTACCGASSKGWTQATISSLRPSPRQKDRLDCVTRLSSIDGPVPARRMQAVLLVDGNHRLVLRWRPYPRASRIGEPPPLTETELLRGLSRVELAFQRANGTWSSGWRSPDLPTLVRIRLHFLANDPRRWPDIVAAPLRDRP